MVMVICHHQQHKMGIPPNPTYMESKGVSPFGKKGVPCNDPAGTRVGFNEKNLQMSRLSTYSTSSEKSHPNRYSLDSQT
jgi:hypothetical protein